MIESYLGITRLVSVSVLAMTMLTGAPALAEGQQELVDVAGSPLIVQGGKQALFDLVRSPALNASPGCVPQASGQAILQSTGPVEQLVVNVQGLPPNTDFDFFVIQVPNAPFGMSWYQGDTETNNQGMGSGVFIGRFSIETFVVAPGSTAAPQTFHNAFPSASPNPATGPIQMYHLGLWFNSPNDAQNAGCPNTVTPFNGEHDAGVQVLNTSNFPDLQGPLINIK